MFKTLSRYQPAYFQIIMVNGLRIMLPYELSMDTIKSKQILFVQVCIVAIHIYQNEVVYAGIIKDLFYSVKFIHVCELGLNVEDTLMFQSYGEGPKKIKAAPTSWNCLRETL